VPAKSIQADWAAQRIKNLSLSTALLDALGLRGRREQVTTLIDKFQYPKFGPGMMWQRVRDLAEGLGVRIALNTEVVGIECRDGRAVAVTLRQDEFDHRLPCDAVISSMPLPDLATAIGPPPAVKAAADRLRYRDFLTVALVVPAQAAFPDNWIYVHTPGVRVGRIQNFGSWSPYLVKDGYTCLGLEYFVNQGDELWQMPDDDLVEFARSELRASGLVTGDIDQRGYVVRVPKAYPVYDDGYAERVAVLRRWLENEARNVQAVGRNGMHKYNNQDHSMLTAMLAVENLAGASHDLWSVNVEAAYHEQRTGPAAGTGRTAPVVRAPVAQPDNHRVSVD
jgi:protoporphyrinogen oxidase